MFLSGGYIHWSFSLSDTTIMKSRDAAVAKAPKSILDYLFSQNSLRILLSFSLNFC